MAEVRRSLRAEQDLEIILEDLSRRGQDIAERYATAFDEKSQLLARFPEMGRTRPEIATNLRSTLVHPYVLFCRLEGEVVQIIHILHGKNDLRSIMKAEPEG